MNQQEITEGNKLIAEFMGLKPGYNSYTKKYNWGDGIFFMTNGDTIEEVMDAIVGYAKYHSSWDWLMPVVGKITKQCEEPDELDGLKYALLCNDIESAWEFVVEYIR